MLIFRYCGAKEFFVPLHSEKQKVKLMNRATRWTLIVACLSCSLEGTTQELIAEKWTPELGMELTSELQGTNAGDYNYVNLLRLNVALPIVSPRSGSPRTTGLTFEIASLSTCMTAKESIGVDLQTFSNLDAGNIPFALSVCGLSWTYASPHRGSRRGASHSLFLGIRNMNKDYFCSDVTSFFTNSSCGIYPTISANYPVANYPVASVGMHYRYEIENENRRFAVQASLYNGTGYNRFTGRENVFRVCPKSDGVFGIAEVSYTRGGSSYFLGNALYCNEKISATPWFYTEQRITSKLSLLAGYSHAFGADIECRDFIGLGALYRLGKCQLGAFTDYANFRERNEFATELTCKVPVLKHLDLQPTVHLITTDGCLKCAATVRMALSI